MKWLGTSVLAWLLAVPLVATAQIRGMGVSPGARAQVGSSAHAVGSLAFRGGGTFAGAHTGFGSALPPSASGFGIRPGVNQFHFPYYRFNRFGVYPFYPYAYSYAYPLGYGGYEDPYNALAPYGYVGGTFDSSYSYPPAYGTGPGGGYPYPPNYGPAPTGSSADVDAQPSAAESQKSSSRSAKGAGSTEAKSEPTVLVFRDGHRQQVSNYAIMGSTLYVLSERNARIPIAALDVSATVQINEERGVEFSVPGQTR